MDCPSGNAYKVSVTESPFCVIWHDRHYVDQPPPVAFPPFGALRHHLPPAERWDNKAPPSNPFISCTTISTGCSATACGVASERNLQGPQGNRKFRETLSRGEVPRSGQGGSRYTSKARLACFPTPAGRLYGFSRQRRHKKWRRRRRTFPAERYYITPEGESPQPACQAKPITGRTLGAQGQRPGGAINPRPRKRASTFGNTGKHRPDPDRAEGA